MGSGQECPEGYKMALEIADLVPAAAIVDGVSAVPAYVAQQGFTSAVITRPGAVGRYRLTLGNGLGLNSAVALGSVFGAVGASVSWVRNSVGDIDINLVDAAATPVDAIFGVVILRVAQ